MSRKRQKIQITIHTAGNVKKVFNRKEITEFWKDKIINKIDEVNLDDNNIRLFEKMSDNKK